MTDNKTEIYFFNQFTICPGAGTNPASSLKPYMSPIILQPKSMFTTLSLGHSEGCSYLTEINYVSALPSLEQSKATSGRLLITVEPQPSSD